MKRNSLITPSSSGFKIKHRMLWNAFAREKNNNNNYIIIKIHLNKTGVRAKRKTRYYVCNSCTSFSVTRWRAIQIVSLHLQKKIPLSAMSGDAVSGAHLCSETYHTQVRCAKRNTRAWKCNNPQQGGGGRYRIRDLLGLFGLLFCYYQCPQEAAFTFFFYLSFFILTEFVILFSVRQPWLERVDRR